MNSVRCRIFPSAVCAGQFVGSAAECPFCKSLAKIGLCGWPALGKPCRTRAHQRGKPLEFDRRIDGARRRRPGGKCLPIGPGPAPPDRSTTSATSRRLPNLPPVRNRMPRRPGQPQLCRDPRVRHLRGLGRVPGHYGIPHASAAHSGTGAQPTPDDRLIFAAVMAVSPTRTGIRRIDGIQPGIGCDIQHGKALSLVRRPAKNAAAKDHRRHGQA